MKIIHIIFLIGFLWLLGQACKIQNESNDNLYILHTKDGDVKCNYHNSRDGGYIEYIDFATKKDCYLVWWKLDSVTVLSEDFWTCGPRKDNIKYINKTK